MKENQNYVCKDCGSTNIKEAQIFPPYIVMKESGGTHLELDSLECGLAIYYRRAGNWEAKIRNIGDKYFIDDSSLPKHLNGQEMIKCTYEEWKENNSSNGVI